MSDQSPRKGPAGQSSHERDLRDMNEALIASSVRQHELTEQADRERDAAETARDTAEQLSAALGESERRYRTLFDAMDEGYCIIEVLFDGRRQPIDYRFIEVNASFERQAGMRDVVGKRMLEFVPAIESHWLQNYGKVALTGEPIRFSGEYEGLHRWFDVYAFRANGWPERHVAVLFADVTQHQWAADQLRESEQRYRTIVDQVRDYAIFSTDARGRATTWNQGVKKVLGFDEGEFIGQDITQAIFTPEDFQSGEAQRELDTAASTGSADNDRWMRRKNGERFFANGVTTALRNDGQLVGFTKVMRDQTERQSFEREREALLTNEQAARIEADAANRAKDQFLAVLSHELRTPLTPVAMAVAALELNADLPPAVRDDLKMIRRNVELEAKLIDDLLDVSRIASGKLRLQFDVLDINDLVRHACDMSRPGIREKGVRLHCALDESTDDVVGDAARLHQVFWNLLNNAAKFTPEDGDIYVTTANAGEQVRVTVRDTGMGIAPEILPNIFDAFAQGEDRITRQFGGLGLGLSICRLLVEQHRGSIRAETGGPNRGSTFVVELPAVSRREVQETPAAPRAGATNGDAPVRVLLVEDHADTLRVLSRLLTASGHAVKTASTAAAALALADERPFDVIISDLGLPDATGYELMKRLAKTHGIKGIALSGFGMEEDLRKSAEAGFSDHLVKPVNLSQLEQSIRRVAGGGDGSGNSSVA